MSSINDTYHNSDNDIDVTKEAEESKHDSDQYNGDREPCLQCTFVQIRTDFTQCHV